MYTDIDECAEGTDRCDQNCHNTIGSYICSCNTGYSLNADGFACDGKLDQNCLSHKLIASKLSTNSPDIDECADDIDGCDHVCNNDVGSYRCSCNVGYRLDPDLHGCNGKRQILIPEDYVVHIITDIDECAEGTGQCVHNCHNTIGSYTCSCNTGYRLNADGFTCVGNFASIQDILISIIYCWF